MYCTVQDSVAVSVLGRENAFMDSNQRKSSLHNFFLYVLRRLLDWLNFVFAQPCDRPATCPPLTLWQLGQAPAPLWLSRGKVVEGWRDGCNVIQARASQTVWLCKSKETSRLRLIFVHLFAVNCANFYYILIVWFGSCSLKRLKINLATVSLLHHDIMFMEGGVTEIKKEISRSEPITEATQPLFI